MVFGVTEGRGAVSRRTRAILAALVFAGSLLPADARSATYFHLPVPDLVPAMVLGILGAGAVLLTPRRLWPLFAVTVLAWLLRSTWPTLLVTSYLAASTYRRSPRVLGYVIAATALEFAPVTASPDPYGLLGGAALFVWLPVAVGLWLDERTAQLTREQEARTGRARAEERARIARDMHDVVAHRVSLMVLHAGALEMNAKDDYTATEAELIRLTGKEALSQLRQVLGVLKSTDVDGSQATIEDLGRLLDQSRSAGVEVTRRDEGTPRELSPMSAATVYRVVQEALTNVHKHAGPTPTTVVLRYRPGAVEVTVTNGRPPHAPDPLPGSGMGLVGLRERVELMGGRFEAGPRDGGFAVVADVPDEREAE
ncbi:signal transduction histidine kinase [Kutzneria sp. 744]|nr:signal transduction histidine kinase [Kutzneria sp. 744]